MLISANHSGANGWYREEAGRNRVVYRPVMVGILGLILDDEAFESLSVGDKVHHLTRTESALAGSGVNTGLHSTHFY